MAINKTTLLAARQRKVESVVLPATVGSTLGGQVAHVRSLTARERGEFDAPYLRPGANFDDYKPRFVMATLCDVDGRPIFDPADYGDVCELDGALIDYLANRAMELNTLRSVEDHAKNSAPTPIAA